MINNLAWLFYKMDGCNVEQGYDFSKAHHPSERNCWLKAETAYKFFKPFLVRGHYENTKAEG